MRLCHCRGAASLPFKVAAAVSSSGCVFDDTPHPPPLPNCCSGGGGGRASLHRWCTFYFFFLMPQLTLSRQLKKRGRSSLLFFSCADRPPLGLVCLQFSAFKKIKKEMPGLSRPHNDTFDPRPRKPDKIPSCTSSLGGSLEIVFFNAVCITKKNYFQTWINKLLCQFRYRTIFFIK